jgi:tetratricopeptide (TPR) repeat protein
MAGRKYAQQLLRRAAERPEELIEKHIYWKPLVFDLYLEKCNERIFENPEAGLALARLAPQLAERVAATHRRLSAPVLRLRAHALLGSAFQMAGDLAAAEKAFATARKEEPSVPALEKAELYRRLAYLRLSQRRPEAFQLIDEAIRIHRLETNLVDRHDLGCCFLARGHVEYELGDPGQALVDLSAAVNHIDPRRGSRFYYAALHNLAGYLADYGSPEQLRVVMDQLRAAHALLGGTKKRSLAKYKLRWLQAVIHARFGQTAKAELTFLEVREGLTELVVPLEVAMVSIDLGLLYLSTGRLAELESLAGETHRLLHHLGADHDALATLLLWHHAARERRVTAAVLKDIRGALMERGAKRRGSEPKSR